MSAPNAEQPTADLLSRLDRATALIRSRAIEGFVPRVGMVLGSGLGAFGDTLGELRKLPYAEVGLPSSAVAGHAGQLCLGYVTDEANTVPVACLQGRVHGYEGHSTDTLVFAVRTLARLGCSHFILTNAAGGVNTALEPGDLMLMRDHLNLTGHSPLTGPNQSELGPRFPDMTTAYDLELRDLAQLAAKKASVTLREGVYAALPGPSYETPAEIRMLRVLGADAVGMSTVPEVIALRHMGKRVVAISCITNKGAGITGQALHHDEVQEVADRTRVKFVEMLKHLILSL